MAKETKADLLKTGQIIRVYGQKTLFGISPAPEIDKVRFSIVDLNTNGKNFLDIYLTTEEVRLFCSEIDSGLAKKKIDADTGNYPTAYQWVRGENGAKKLIIGGGKKGVRVQAIDGTDKSNVIRKMAVIQHSDLKELSFLFKLVYGLIPVVEGSYYHKLYCAFNESVGKYKHQNYNEDSDSVTHAVVDETAQEQQEVEQERNKKEQEEKPVSKAEVYTTIAEGMFKKVTDKQGHIFKGIPVVIEETKEKTTLVFKQEDTEKLSWFKAYEEKTNKGENVKLKVKAERKGKAIYFVDVIRK